VSREIFVRRIVNSPIDSNSFVVYFSDSAECIVIDPGTAECSEMLLFLEDNALIPVNIFLTHEHFDHIWGVNKLKDIYNSKIVSSRECAGSIIDKKKNMSVFYNQVGFQTYPSDILIEDLKYDLVLNNVIIEFIVTKGHSEGSICILAGDNLFTGDTIIYNTKTVVKFPGGDKEKVKMSFDLISSKVQGRGVKVFPGHGECFSFDEINLENLL
jgi:glyoxylase-like metal-dependent hydrolase (beta-lactamase superfamily II)